MQWAVASFTQKKRECSIELHAGLGVAGSGFVLSGSWANANSVEHRSGPHLPSLPTGQPSDHDMELNLDGAQSPPCNQTVFLRELCVHVRSFGAAPKIKAAAMPRRDNPSPEHDPRGCSLTSTLTCNVNDAPANDRHDLLQSNGDEGSDDDSLSSACSVRPQSDFASFSDLESTLSSDDQARQAVVRGFL